MPNCGSVRQSHSQTDTGVHLIIIRFLPRAPLFTFVVISVFSAEYTIGWFARQIFALLGP
jgi:hypothetical protein